MEFGFFVGFGVTLGLVVGFGVVLAPPPDEVLPDCDGFFTVRFLTVTLQVNVLRPTLALILAVPAFLAVTRPFLLTEAIFFFVLLHFILRFPLFLTFN